MNSVASQLSRHYLWVQGLYAAIGMAGVTAARDGKTKEAANVAAELVRLGWGVLVDHTLAFFFLPCSYYALCLLVRMRLRSLQSHEGSFTGTWKKPGNKAYTATVNFMHQYNDTMHGVLPMHST